ncbi:MULTISPECIES: peptidylprolyl isomerase [Olleya]|uniref:Periplasmic chaperone PpiD n=1 Tax=Olleya namhaensis TaxID=1144750 RepID=A0A1I3LD20_9FLAO|nr:MULTISPECIES: peptidylprolyl isomerase [Olleya]PKG49964.1 peptidylprolyl isomerase [Olleya sp. 1-3]SFI82406.1 peptidyl-prolyl cis-trans isomerase D [Olleya namhaensis]
MAILNKIRQKTVVLILVIALALFAFILSSLFDNKDALFSKSPDVVATINGQDISRAEFSNLVEFQQRQMGPNATTSQVMNSVFESKVREIVMDGQISKLGMTVESEQMRDLIKTNYASDPTFLNEGGVFDESKVKLFIDNLKSSSTEAYQNWISGEQALASNALQANYFNMVKAGTTATLAEGKLEHKLEGEKVDIKYVQVPFSSIADSTVKVSTSEIKSYINKNPKAYQSDATRGFQYVFFKEVASLEDEKAMQKELTDLLSDSKVYNEVTKATDNKAGFKNTTDNEAFVNGNSDDFKFVDKYQYKSSLPNVIADTIFKLNPGQTYGPYKDGNYYKVTKVLDFKRLADSIESSHIVIPFVGSTRAGADVTRTKEQAKAMIDSIYPLVKNSKTKFAEVANQINADGTKGKDGVIGWTRLTTYNPAAFDPDFANFLFFNDKGSIDVVLSQFGYHIIRIDDKKNVDNTVKVATIARKIQPSSKTEDKIFADASNFELAIANGNFAEVAKTSNYDVRPMTAKELDESIPGLGNQRQIVRWSFEDGTKVGDYKRFDNVPGGIVIAQLTAMQDKGVMSVEDASVTALPAVRKEKKAKMIMDRVNASSLEDFAKAENQTVKSASAINMKNPTIAGAGTEPMVVGTAFGLAEGATSKLVKGNTGVFMVQVTKKTAAVELENYLPFANQVSTQKLNSVQTRLYNALKESSEIEDFRAKTVQ